MRLGKWPAEGLSPAEVRDRLIRHSARTGCSLADMSRMLGRNPAYLSHFTTRGRPRPLEPRERGRLARYMGIDERELGAPGQSDGDRACDRRAHRPHGYRADCRTGF